MSGPAARTSQPQNQRDQQPARIVIVGGGLAGLSAAVYLLKESRGRFHVTVVEAAPHLGGQAASWLKNGRAEEMGIHLDFPWYTNKLRLYEDVGQPLELVQTDGHYYICNGQTGKVDKLVSGVQTGSTGVWAAFSAVSRAFYGLWNFPGLTKRESWWVLRFVYKLLRMTTAEIDRCDEPVDDYLRRLGATENLIKQLSLATVTIQGVYIHNASAASFMKFLKASYGCTTPMNPAFFTRPTGEALITPLERFIRAQGGEIRVGEPAQAIAVDDQQLSITTVTAQLPCDYLILAMPGYLVPPLLPGRYRSDPAFAPLAKLSSGQVITLTLWYDAAWFPDHNVYISNREGVLFDAVADKARHWKNPAEKGSAVQVLIDAAEDITDWSDERIVEQSLADLARFFPPAKYPRPDRPAAWSIIRHRNIYCETRPGYWQIVPNTHETPISNLYLAGDYTAGLYHYGMESAVISGKETANLIRAKHGLAEHPKVPVSFLPFVRR